MFGFNGFIVSSGVVGLFDIFSLLGVTGFLVLPGYIGFLGFMAVASKATLNYWLHCIHKLPWFP